MLAVDATRDSSAASAMLPTAPPSLPLITMFGDDT